MSNPLSFDLKDTVIIIRLNWQHKVLWLLLTTRPYHPSLRDWIQYPHRTVVSLCWPAQTGVSMCRGPYENDTYELHFTFPTMGCPRGVMVKAMDCGIVVREFVLQSRYYVHIWSNTLGKGMNPLILPAMC